ncbi:O-antigen translocase [Vibrio splendidus]
MKFKELLLKGGILSIVRILTGFITMKVIAIVGGPSVMALVGQAQSFVQLVHGMVANQLSQGVGRYTAEDERYLNKIWSSAMLISVTIAFVLTIFGLYVSEALSQEILYSKEYSWLLILCVTLLPISCVGIFFNNVLNSLGLQKDNIKSQLLSLLILTTLNIFSLYIFGLQGILISTLLSGVVTSLVYVYVIKRSGHINLLDCFTFPEGEQVKKLSKYVLVGLIAAALGPTVMILIRNIITSELGIDITGVWQALNRLSNVLYTVLTMPVAMYLYPKLSKIKIKNDLDEEITLVLKYLVPLVSLACCLLYILRDFIVYFLLTEEFSLISDVYYAQLISDFLKIISFVPASVMLAKGYLKLFIGGEALVHIATLVAVKFLIGSQELEGVCYAYVFSYALYLTYSFIVLWKHRGTLS